MRVAADSNDFAREELLTICGGLAFWLVDAGVFTAEKFGSVWLVAAGATCALSALLAETF